MFCRFKIFVFIFLITGTFITKGQDIDDIYRIDSYKFACPTSDEYLKQLYKVGIKSLNNDEHVNLAGKIFFQIIEKDKALCDAYYFTGVSLTKQDKHKAALTYYFYADSLSSSPNLKFKEELAEAALRVSSVGLARKEYENIVEKFPNSPIGFYGIGLTATSLGDYERGIECLELAEQKFVQINSLTEKRKSEVLLMKGILYTQLKQYEEAVVSFEGCEDMFGQLLDYLANYAWSTYNLYLQTHDVKWEEKCKATLSKLRKLPTITQEFLDKFTFKSE
ncbi:MULTISPECIES: tetratricopeptide repeat protein [Myroides]|uniref:Tetratricopeptide repeat protein n=1 Tax=Myroides albus TaxID=2562892 RepID=A0A6I3LKE6_9FLAO|nr:MULTISPECIES: hypothetical protein [Myroides]MTG96981.1 hypothetical protein [Myroides albus]MVX35404.1 hypothetical protein [Myroides sp. LoEW2-1]UVD80529.1 hypothetical protein NWE55_04485 [Myroides albus]